MTLDNAYRPRKGQEDRIPHSFTFRKRESFLAVYNMCVKPHSRCFLCCEHLCLPQGLPSSLPLSERLPRRYEPGPHDIFAIVKHHMCDEEPCQPALLVPPGDESNAVKRFWSQSVDHHGVEPSIEYDRKKDLLELADAFKQYPNFDRAISYLKALGGQGRRTRFEVHDLPFVRAGGTRPATLVCGNVTNRHERATPHPLQVRFHRP